MSLKYLLDEDILGLASAVARYNEWSAIQIDLVAVGRPGAPVRRTRDDVLLLWAEAFDRILVTNDKGTMPRWLRAHLDAGHYCPGVFQLRQQFSIAEILDYLAVAAFVMGTNECANKITWIP
jgi:hypothetical protein